MWPSSVVTRTRIPPLTLTSIAPHRRFSASGRASGVASTLVIFISNSPCLWLAGAERPRDVGIALIDIGLVHGDGRHVDDAVDGHTEDLVGEDGADRLQALVDATDVDRRGQAALADRLEAGAQAVGADRQDPVLAVPVLEALGVDRLRGAERHLLVLAVDGVDVRVTLEQVLRGREALVADVAPVGLADDLQPGVLLERDLEALLTGLGPRRARRTPDLQHG